MGSLPTGAAALTVAAGAGGGTAAFTAAGATGSAATVLAVVAGAGEGSAALKVAGVAGAVVGSAAVAGASGVVGTGSSITSCSLDWAATRALVRPSAPLSTNEISLRTALRTTWIGPLMVLPLTVTLWPAGTNSASITAAPMLACHGKPLVPLLATSLAQEVLRLIRPSAMTEPFSMATRCVWPTPWRGLWSRRTGMSCRSIDRPSRSTTTGCGKPSTRMGPPV
jgi:hypothetical protein